MNENVTTMTVKTPAANFTGDVWMNRVFGGDGASQLTVGLVRFTPAARTNWHRHANGQLLVCTDGVGLVGTRDGHTVLLWAGESVWTPAASPRCMQAPRRTPSTSSASTPRRHQRPPAPTE